MLAWPRRRAIRSPTGPAPTMRTVVLFWDLVSGRRAIVRESLVLTFSAIIGQFVSILSIKWL
jgi:hypothetical protein